MNLKQFIGWFLLFTGVILIVGILYPSWQIFTGKKEAPEIFTTSQLTEDQPSSLRDRKSQTPEELISETFGEQLKVFLSSDSTPEFLNLVSWSIFAGILIFGGGQLAGIGIKLLQQ